MPTKTRKQSAKKKTTTKKRVVSCGCGGAKRRPRKTKLSLKKLLGL